MPDPDPPAPEPGVTRILWGSRDPVDSAATPEAGASQRFTRTNPDATDAAAPGACPPTADVPLPAIPGYEVLRLLGRGGMGIVYLARHLRLNRLVALKMVLGRTTQSAPVLDRFRKEALAVSRLNHPNITQVFDSGEWEGRPFLALEYVEGGTLADRTAGIPQPPRDAAVLVESLARAVDYAHRQGVVHRDLKPANVLLSVARRPSSVAENAPATGATTDLGRGHGQRTTGHGLSPKVTDFGLARWLEAEGGTTATRDGYVFGTPSYMAPEQAGGVARAVGPAADVYALGAILYELLTGRPPFRGTSPMETVLQVLAHDPVPPRRLQPGVPRDLETVALTCLAREPRQRYVSAGALADDLRRFLDGQPIVARPVGPLRRAWKWATRRPAAAALVSVSALALLVIAVGGAWYNARLQSELTRSERLFGEGHRLVRWLLKDHNNALSGLRGGAAAQKELVRELLAYLDALTAQAADHGRIGEDLTLSDIADAYELLADVQGNPIRQNLGQAREAIESCRKSLALRRRALAARPGDPDARTDLACTLVRLGELQAAAGEDPPLDEARAEAEAALRQRPDGSRQRVAVLAVEWLGADLLAERGDTEGALRGHRAVLDRCRSLFGDPPADARDRVQLAACHGRVGGLLQARGDFAGARTHYAAALDLSRGVADERHVDARAQRALGQALTAFGDLLTADDPRRAEAIRSVAAAGGSAVPGADRLMRFRLALPSYEASLAIRREQAKVDQLSAAASADLTAVLERLGLCRLALGDLPAASAAFDEALGTATQLARDDPDRVENRRNVWVFHGRVAEALAGAGDLKNAERHYTEKWRLAGELVARYPQSIPDWYGVAEAHMGLALVGIGRLRPEWTPAKQTAAWRAAADHYRGCLEVFDKLDKWAPAEPRRDLMRAAARRSLRTAEQTLAAIEKAKG